MRCAYVCTTSADCSDGKVCTGHGALCSVCMIDIFYCE